MIRAQTTELSSSRVQVRTHPNFHQVVRAPESAATQLVETVRIHRILVLLFERRAGGLLLESHSLHHSRGRRPLAHKDLPVLLETAAIASATPVTRRQEIPRFLATWPKLGNLLEHFTALGAGWTGVTFGCVCVRWIH